MRTEEVKIYQFDELSDDAKEKAREWWKRHGLDYEWWDGIYSDAERIGLEITGFDDYKVEGNFTSSARNAAECILKEHGEHCDTFIEACKFLKLFDELEKQDDLPLQEDYIEQVEEDFHYSLLEEYRIMLRKEAEYLMSDEYVDETIIANEYEFTEDGERF